MRIKNKKSTYSFYVKKAPTNNNNNTNKKLNKLTCSKYVLKSSTNIAKLIFNWEQMGQGSWKKKLHFIFLTNEAAST